MSSTNVKPILDALAQQVLPSFVAVERASNPHLTGEALVEEVLGDAKHYLRKKIGWGVDVLWVTDGFADAMRENVRTAIAASSVPASLLNGALDAVASNPFTLPPAPAPNVAVADMPGVKEHVAGELAARDVPLPGPAPESIKEHPNT